MFSLPEEIIQVIWCFSPLFSARVWFHAHILLIGAILAPGKRTVSSILRIMGLSQARDYVNYHRVLNRAVWSGRMGSRILLGLLVRLVPCELPLVLGIDETLERRRGKQIKKKGCHRDPVRSTKRAVVRCLGLQWLSMMLLVPLPWSKRVWALPFLTVLVAPAPKGAKNKEQPCRHKTAVDWTRQMLQQVSRWQPARRLILIGDGAFAAIELVLTCRTLHVPLIARLRWDAALYHPPGKQPAGKKGPKPKKGPRQRRLSIWTKRADTPWQEQDLVWYGGKPQKRCLFSRTALWHRVGYDPVPIRYVIVRDPAGKQRDDVLFSSDPDLDPVQIVQYFVMRWSVEVTFEEVRAHLGFESLRNWKDKAVERTSPAILSLFSIITLLANRLKPAGDIPVQQSAWYKKTEPTFADVLTLVRHAIWKERLLENSEENHELAYFKHELRIICSLYDYPLVA